MAEKMNLTPEQQEAISEIDRNLQIIACAGSGKTEVITRRIANILQSKPELTYGPVPASSLHWPLYFEIPSRKFAN